MAVKRRRIWVRSEESAQARYLRCSEGADRSIRFNAGGLPDGFEVCATLDVIDRRANLLAVETVPMKVVGQIRKTPWQRFVRLQATAALLAKGKGQPKGVYRFTSHEECAQWTSKLRKV